MTGWRENTAHTRAAILSRCTWGMNCKYIKDSSDSQTHLNVFIFFLSPAAFISHTSVMPLAASIPVLTSALLFFSCRFGGSSCVCWASDRRESCPHFIPHRAAAQDQRAGGQIFILHTGSDSKLPSKIAPNTTKRERGLEFMSGHKWTVFISPDFLCVASVNQCRDFLLSLFVAPWLFHASLSPKWKQRKNGAQGMPTVSSLLYCILFASSKAWWEPKCQCLKRIHPESKKEKVSELNHVPPSQGYCSCIFVSHIHLFHCIIRYYVMYKLPSIVKQAGYQTGPLDILKYTWQ